MNLRNRFSSRGPHSGIQTGIQSGFPSDSGFASNSVISSALRAADFDRGNARAVRVNRTRRVVQERAKTIAARRSRIRSLWLPLVLFSTLLVGICIAVWVLLDEYDLAAAGSQVSSYQVLVPLFWSVPVSAALLAVVWFRQTRDTRRGPIE